MSIKPGYRTSEFWFTLISFLFSGLFLIGVISDSSHKEDLIRDVTHGVESVILIGGQLAILFKYINSRKEMKKELVHQEEVVLKLEAKKNEHTRKPNTRTTNISKRKPRSTGNS